MGDVEPIRPFAEIFWIRFISPSALRPGGVTIYGKAGGRLYVQPRTKGNDAYWAKFLATFRLLQADDDELKNFNIGTILNKF